MKYTWKAITCCVGKGLLVLLLIVCTFGGCIGLSEYSDKRKRSYCDALMDEANAATAQSVYRGLRDKYAAECTSQPPSKGEKIAAVALASLTAFGLAGMLLAAICSANITYCQVAVDTKRKPWYWLPKWAGGDPLPGRELVKCASCGNEEPESDEAYRARVLA
jgi:hypothetical protein